MGLLARRPDIEAQPPARGFPSGQVDVGDLMQLLGGQRIASGEAVPVRLGTVTDRVIIRQKVYSSNPQGVRTASEALS